MLSTSVSAKLTHRESKVKYHMSLFELFLSRLGLIGAFVPSLLLYAYYCFKCIRPTWFPTLVIRLAAMIFLSLCIVIITQWYFNCPTWLGDCYRLPNALFSFVELIKFLAFYLVTLPAIGLVGLPELTAVASTFLLLTLIIGRFFRKGEIKR